jgi:DNA-binding IclR family transcriptional regulator
VKDKDMEKKSTPAPGTQVLRRSHDILRLLAKHHRSGMRMTDIASGVGLEPPTAHRIVQGLVQERMATHDAGSRRYFLGPALYEMGLAAAWRFPLRELAQESVERLAKTTGDTVVLTVRSGSEGVCVERRTGEFPIRTSTVAVGVRRPLAAGAGGLAILSCLDEAQRLPVLEANARALNRKLADLQELVDATARRGHSINVYAATEPPISSVGVPLLGAFGECVGGLAVVALSMRLSGPRQSEVTALLEAEGVHMRRILARNTQPR